MRFNHRLLRSAQLLAAGTLLSSAASAGVFTLSWTGNPALDAQIVNSGDPAAALAGSIELNVGAGQAFTAANVVAASLTLTGTGFAPLAFGTISFLSGTVSADGLSASLTDFFLGDGSVPSFGCASFAGDCRVNSGYNIGSSTSAGLATFLYSSTAAAQASYHLTAGNGNGVPLPGTLALALAGLGLLAAGRKGGSAAA